MDRQKRLELKHQQKLREIEMRGKEQLRNLALEEIKKCLDKYHSVEALEYLRSGIENAGFDFDELVENVLKEKEAAILREKIALSVYENRNLSLAEKKKIFLENEPIESDVYDRYLSDFLNSKYSALLKAADDKTINNVDHEIFFIGRMLNKNNQIVIDEITAKLKKIQEKKEKELAFQKQLEEREAKRQEEKDRNQKLLKYCGIAAIVALVVCILITVVTANPQNNAKKCNAAVVVAINDGDLKGAMATIEAFEKSSNKIFKSYKLLINAESSNNNTYAVKRIIKHYAQHTTEDEADLKEKHKYFYNILMTIGEVDEAEQYIDLPQKSLWSGNRDKYETYYDYLSKGATTICSLRTKKEAKKWVSNKVDFYKEEKRKLYDGKPNPWYSENVKKRLNEIIDKQ